MSDDFDLGSIPLPPSISPPQTLGEVVEVEAHGLFQDNIQDNRDIIEFEKPPTSLPITKTTEKVQEIDNLYNLYKIEDLFSDSNSNPSQNQDIEFEKPPTKTTEKVQEIDNLYKIEDLFSDPNPGQDQDALNNCDDKPAVLNLTDYNYTEDSASDTSEDQKLLSIIETPLLEQIHSQIKEDSTNKINHSSRPTNTSSSSDEEETFTQVKAKFIVGLTFEEINIQFYRDGIETGLPLDLKALFTFNYCRLCSVNFKGSDESELLARFHYKSDLHLRNTWDWLKKNNIAAPKPMHEIEVINSIKAWLQDCSKTLEKDNPVIDPIPDTFESLISKFEVQKSPAKKLGRKKAKLNKKSKKEQKNSPTKSPTKNKTEQPEYSDHSSDSFDEFYYQSSAEEGDCEENNDNDGDAYNPAGDPGQGQGQVTKTEPQYSDNGSSIGGSIFSYSSTEKTLQTENTNRNVKDMDLDSDFDDQKSIKERIRNTLDLSKMFQPLHCLLCEFQSTQNLVAKMHYRGKIHQSNIDKWLNSQVDQLNPENLNILWFPLADNIIKDHIKSFKIYDDKVEEVPRPPTRTTNTTRSTDNFSSFTKPNLVTRPLSLVSDVSLDFESPTRNKSFESPHSRKNEDFSNFTRPNLKRPLSEASFISSTSDDFDYSSSFTKPLIQEPPREACYDSNPNLQPVLNKRVKNNDNYNNGNGGNKLGIAEKLAMFANTNLSQSQNQNQISRQSQSPLSSNDQIGYSSLNSKNNSEQIGEKKIPPLFADRTPYKSHVQSSEEVGNSNFIENPNIRGGYRGSSNNYRGNNRGRGDFRGRGRGRGQGQGQGQGQEVVVVGGYKGRNFNPDFKRTKSQFRSYETESRVKKESDPIKNYYTNCSLCQVDLRSREEAETHFLSVKHKDRMKKLSY